MRRPEHVPELGLRGRPVGVHVEAETELQQLLLLVPVDVVVDLDRLGAGRQDDLLLDRRRAERAADANDRPIVLGVELEGVDARRSR